MEYYQIAIMLDYNQLNEHEYRKILTKINLDYLLQLLLLEWVLISKILMQ